jgi:endogenous inhibitor of DNA gyrase (YacG/DUF329 family)
MSTAAPASPCPRCAQLVSVTLATSETGVQLAADHTDCPHCGTRLMRAIEGHTDRGWRVAERPSA